MNIIPQNQCLDEFIYEELIHDPYYNIDEVSLIDLSAYGYYKLYVHKFLQQKGLKNLTKKQKEKQLFKEFNINKDKILNSCREDAYVSFPDLLTIILQRDPDLYQEVYTNSPDFFNDLIKTILEERPEFYKDLVIHSIKYKLEQLHKETVETLDEKVNVISEQNQENIKNISSIKEEFKILNKESKQELEKIIKDELDRATENFQQIISKSISPWEDKNIRNSFLWIVANNIATAIYIPLIFIAAVKIAQLVLETNTSDITKSIFNGEMSGGFTTIFLICIILLLIIFATKYSPFNKKKEDNNKFNDSEPQ